MHTTRNNQHKLSIEYWSFGTPLIPNDQPSPQGSVQNKPRAALVVGAPLFPQPGPEVLGMVRFINYILCLGCAVVTNTQLANEACQP